MRHILISIIILVLGAVPLMAIFWLRSGAQRRKTEIYERNKQASQRLTESLKGKTVCVVIRTYDGRKTTLESAVVGLLAKTGVEVRYVCADDATRLWRQESDVSVNADLLIVGYLRAYPYFDACRSSVDLRLLTGDTNKILGAKIVDTDKDDDVIAECIVNSISEFFIGPELFKSHVVTA